MASHHGYNRNYPIVRVPSELDAQDLVKYLSSTLSTFPAFQRRTVSGGHVQPPALCITPKSLAILSILHKQFLIMKDDPDLVGPSTVALIRLMYMIERIDTLLVDYTVTSPTDKSEKSTYPFTLQPFPFLTNFLSLCSAALRPSYSPPIGLSSFLGRLRHLYFYSIAIPPNADALWYILGTCFHDTQHLLFDPDPTPISPASPILSPSPHVSSPTAHHTNHLVLNVSHIWTLFQHYSLHYTQQIDHSISLAHNLLLSALVESHLSSTHTAGGTGHSLPSSSLIDGTSYRHGSHHLPHHLPISSFRMSPEMYFSPSIQHSAPHNEHSLAPIEQNALLRDIPEDVIEAVVQSNALPYVWRALLSLVVSATPLTRVGPSLVLTPYLQHLDLSWTKVSDLRGLFCVPLTELNLTGCLSLAIDPRHVCVNANHHPSFLGSWFQFKQHHTPMASSHHHHYNQIGHDADRRMGQQPSGNRNVSYTSAQQNILSLCQSYDNLALPCAITTLVYEAPALRKLNLSHMNITDAMIPKLALLSHLPLTHLDLSHNKITSIVSLWPLRAITTLRSITIASNPCSERPNYRTDLAVIFHDCWSAQPLISPCPAHPEHRSRLQQDTASSRSVISPHHDAAGTNPEHESDMMVIFRPFLINNLMVSSVEAAAAKRAAQSISNALRLHPLPFAQYFSHFYVPPDLLPFLSSPTLVEATPLSTGAVVDPLKRVVNLQKPQASSQSTPSPAANQGDAHSTSVMRNQGNSIQHLLTTLHQSTVLNVLASPCLPDQSLEATISSFLYANDKVDYSTLTKTGSEVSLGSISPAAGFLDALKRVPVKQTSHVIGRVSSPQHPTKAARHTRTPSLANSNMIPTPDSNTDGQFQLSNHHVSGTGHHASSSGNASPMVEGGLQPSTSSIELLREISNLDQLQLGADNEEMEELDGNVVVLSRGATRQKRQARKKIAKLEQKLQQEAIKQRHGQEMHHDVDDVGDLDAKNHSIDAIDEPIVGKHQHYIESSPIQSYALAYSNNENSIELPQPLTAPVNPINVIPPFLNDTPDDTHHHYSQYDGNQSLSKSISMTMDPAAAQPHATGIPTNTHQMSLDERILRQPLGPSHARHPTMQSTGQALNEGIGGDSDAQSSSLGYNDSIEEECAPPVLKPTNSQDSAINSLYNHPVTVDLSHHEQLEQHHNQRQPVNIDDPRRHTEIQYTFDDDDDDSEDINDGEDHQDVISVNDIHRREINLYRNTLTSLDLDTLVMHPFACIPLVNGSTAVDVGVELNLNSTDLYEQCLPHNDDDIVKLLTATHIPCLETQMHSQKHNKQLYMPFFPSSDEENSDDQGRHTNDHELHHQQTVTTSFGDDDSDGVLDTTEYTGYPRKTLLELLHNNPNILDIHNYAAVPHYHRFKEGTSHDDDCLSTCSSDHNITTAIESALDQVDISPFDLSSYISTQRYYVPPSLAYSQDPMIAFSLLFLLLSLVPRQSLVDTVEQAFADSRARTSNIAEVHSCFMQAIEELYHHIDSFDATKGASAQRSHPPRVVSSLVMTIGVYHSMLQQNDGGHAQTPARAFHKYSRQRRFRSQLASIISTLHDMCLEDDHQEHLIHYFESSKALAGNPAVQLSSDFLSRLTSAAFHTMTLLYSSLDGTVRDDTWNSSRPPTGHPDDENDHGLHDATQTEDLLGSSFFIKYGLVNTTRTVPPPDFDDWYHLFPLDDGMGVNQSANHDVAGVRSTKTLNTSSNQRLYSEDPYGYPDSPNAHHHQQPLATLPSILFAVRVGFDLNALPSDRIKSELNIHFSRQDKKGVMPMQHEVTQANRHQVMGPAIFPISTQFTQFMSSFFRSFSTSTTATNAHDLTSTSALAHQSLHFFDPLSNQALTYTTNSRLRPDDPSYQSHLEHFFLTNGTNDGGEMPTPHDHFIQSLISNQEETADTTTTVSPSMQYTLSPQVVSPPYPLALSRHTCSLTGIKWSNLVGCAGVIHGTPKCISIYFRSANTPQRLLQQHRGPLVDFFVQSQFAPSLLSLHHFPMLESLELLAEYQWNELYSIEFGISMQYFTLIFTRASGPYRTPMEFDPNHPSAAEHHLAQSKAAAAATASVQLSAHKKTPMKPKNDRLAHQRQHEMSMDSSAIACNPPSISYHTIITHDKSVTTSIATALKTHAYLYCQNDVILHADYSNTIELLVNALIKYCNAAKLPFISSHHHADDHSTFSQSQSFSRAEINPLARSVSSSSLIPSASQSHFPKTPLKVQTAKGHHHMTPHKQQSLGNDANQPHSSLIWPKEDVRIRFTALVMASCLLSTASISPHTCSIYASPTLSLLDHPRWDYATLLRQQQTDTAPSAGVGTGTGALDVPNAASLSPDAQTYSISQHTVGTIIPTIPSHLLQLVVIYEYIFLVRDDISQVDCFREEILSSTRHLRHAEQVLPDTTRSPPKRDRPTYYVPDEAVARFKQHTYDPLRKFTVIACERLSNLIKYQVVQPSAGLRSAGPGDTSTSSHMAVNLVFGTTEIFTSTVPLARLWSVHLQKDQVSSFLSQIENSKAK